MGSHVVADPLCYRKISVFAWVSCPQNHIPDYIEIFEEPRTNQNVRHSSIWRTCMLYLYNILSFKFWFLVVHGVCHLDFGDGNPHVKYLCAVANFYDEYYSVIGPFRIF